VEAPSLAMPFRTLRARRWNAPPLTRNPATPIRVPTAALSSCGSPKARFAQAIHSLNQNKEDVVTVYFYNRADHTRQVAISVDYSAP
jgi:hypothetical protein